MSNGFVGHSPPTTRQGTKRGHDDLMRNDDEEEEEMDTNIKRSNTGQNDCNDMLKEMNPESQRMCQYLSMVIEGKLQPVFGELLTLQKRANIQDKTIAQLQEDNRYLCRELDKTQLELRRNNLIIKGVTEDPLETDESRQKKLTEIINKGMGLKDIEIDTAIRIGKQNDKFPRPIKARFVKQKDRNAVNHIANKKKLMDIEKFKKVYVNADLPYNYQIMKRQEREDKKKSMSHTKQS
jgi:hypothetical protein